MSQSNNRGDVSKLTMNRWRKDVSALTPIYGAVEMPLERQQGYLTPNEDFFICSAGEPPAIDVADWRLRLGGDAASAAVDLSLADLEAMAQKTVPAYLECAGNHRRMYQDLKGHDLYWRPGVEEVMWNIGGVGMAEWTGVPLVELLDLAGLDPATNCIVAEGHDKGLEGDEGIRCALPIEKARDPETLVAIRMNGEPLPLDHGYPARLIVPGWVGTYSIKWLDTLNAYTEHQWVYRNTIIYVLMGDQWPREQYAPANGGPVTEQTIKSSLALSWPATLEVGQQRINGYARSPGAKIASVQWSDDQGATWHEADLIGPNQTYAWVQFAFDWVATPGEHTLITRAADTAGRMQPDEMPFNVGGYLYNEPHPHPVTVIA